MVEIDLTSSSALSRAPEQVHRQIYFRISIEQGRQGRGKPSRPFGDIEHISLELQSLTAELQNTLERHFSFTHGGVPTTGIKVKGLNEKSWWLRLLVVAEDM